MKIRKKGLTNPKRYVILWVTMCVADTGYLGYHTVNGGDVITIKPRLHRYCTEVFCYARKASDKLMTTPLVSAVAEMSSKGTVRGAVTN